MKTVLKSTTAVLAFLGAMAVLTGTAEARGHHQQGKNHHAAKVAAVITPSVDSTDHGTDDQSEADDAFGNDDSAGDVAGNDDSSDDTAGSDDSGADDHGNDATDESGDGDQSETESD